MPSDPPVPWQPCYAHALEHAQYFRGRAGVLDLLARWLDDPRPERRVVALCAVGGTGKTAVAAQALEGWFARHGGADRGLPGGVFVWSFYEDDRVDELLGEACEYFRGEAGPLGGRAERLKDALRTGEPHLLVLDGMERVQAEGAAHRDRGEIEDPALRTLLRLVAAGQLGATRVLVTSRFPVCNLAGLGYREVTLDDLDDDAARAVLRAWGVRGEDAALDRLAARVHGHALSVRVLGAYLGRFFEGDAAAGLDLDLGELAHDLGDADRKARRLDRLVEHYARAMRDDERAAMARLSLFPRGVGLEQMLLIADAGWSVSGSLGGRAPAELRALLEGLVTQGLAFGHGEAGRRAYSAHPFLRDAFAKLVDVPATRVHEALRERLATRLEARPGEAPRDAEALDRYERLIDVTRMAGRERDAYELYRRGMGGYENLAWALGDYARGARVVASFARHGDPATMSQRLDHRARAHLLDAWGLYAGDLGDLHLALRCFVEAENINRRMGCPLARAANFENASETAARLGWLPAAARCAEGALKLVRETDYDAIKYNRAHLAYALGLMGDLPAAWEHFAEATRLERGALCSVRGLQEAEVKARAGDREGARAQCEDNLALCEEEGWANTAGHLRALLGRLALPGDPPAARRYLAEAREWARRSGDAEVALRAHLLAAEIALYEGDADRAGHEAAEGAALADAHGFGLYAIDLRIALARVHLARGEHHEALRRADEARERASDPDCRYHWGEADAAAVAELALERGGR